MKMDQCLKLNAQLIVLLVINIIMIHAGYVAKRKVDIVKCQEKITEYRGICHRTIHTDKYSRAVKKARKVRNEKKELIKKYNDNKSKLSY